MRIQKTSNVKLQKINMAITGPSKSGKTYLTSTIKGKVLLLNADKGSLTLKHKNIDMVSVTKWSEIVEFMQFITNKATMDKYKYNWVVFDSISQIAEILSEHLEEKGVKGFDFWGEYKKLIGSLIKTTRDTTLFNSLSIYELVEKENDSGLLEKKMGLQGSLSSQVPYFYDFIFASKKVEKKDKTQYVIQTTNNGGYNFLGGRGITLNAYEPANINHIISKLLKEA